MYFVLEQTPFYAESGGQVGDIGQLAGSGWQLPVVNTKKENDLIIHFAEQLPADMTGEITATVNTARRHKISVHHSVTHLMHAALQNVLGKHVAQKGSLVNEDNLRFDFSHFAKMTEEDIKKLIDTEKIKISNKKERELLLNLFRFNDVIDEILEDLNLNRLCDYIYAIAVKFSEFYTDDSSHILGNEHTNSRLLIIELTKRFMKLSFDLMGLTPMEKI